jgi:20S proteasome alpha/beta subunit
MLAEKIQANKVEFQKTGTTICGVLFDGGVVLAADTRVSLLIKGHCRLYCSRQEL